jgi:hypothetical protein
MYRKVFVIVLLLFAGFARAELPGVLRWDVQQDFTRTYREVYRSLEDYRFFIVYEANIGHDLQGYAARRGEGYDRNELNEIRTMVFINALYTNQLSDQDPDLLTLCPLHITMYQKGPTTSILFTRPTHAGQGSVAMPLLKDIEAEVSKAVEAGITAAQGR